MLCLRVLLTTLLAGAACWCAPSQADADPLQRIILDKTVMIGEWRNSAHLLTVLSIAGVVIGFIIGVLQTLKPGTGNEPGAIKSNWPRIAAAVLGAIGAAITFYISQAPVNAGTYRKVILQADAKVSELRDIICYLGATNDTDAQKSLKEEFTRKVKEFNSLQLKLSGEDRKESAAAFQLIDTVHAQSGSKVPDWANNPPSSPNEVYFVGKAQHRALQEAKTASYQDAIEHSAKYMTGEDRSMRIENAREYAKSSTAVANTSFYFDSRSQTYIYFTMLRLDKALARPAVIGALAVVPGATEVGVIATRNWTDTGISLRAGETVTFTAAGEIHWGRAANAITGPDGSTEKTNARLGNYPVPGMGAGGLIGRIGNGTPFRIGARTVFRVAENGTLFLGINDNIFSDNSGSFRVTIQRSAR